MTRNSHQGGIAPAVLLAFVLLIIFAFIFVVIVPGYKSASLKAAKRYCHSNITQITANIEMAYLDGQDQKDLSNSDGEIKSSFLNGKNGTFSCPFSGKYMISSGADSYVFCTFHGNTENKVKGREDPGYSSFFWLKRWLDGILK